MVRMQFDNITCFVGQRRLLKDVTGDARPGELLALMGASGGGKTTLLNLLYGEGAHGSRVAGSIRINGDFLVPSMRMDIAYIRQEVVLPTYLSPLEHLTYTAAFHLPEHKRAAKVESLIKLFGLEDCKDTRIGTGQETPDGKRDGISGGERRRVYIAAELIRGPRLILVDEPTSGLDYHKAIDAVRQLKEVAVGRRQPTEDDVNPHQLKEVAASQQCTVIMAIHQPSTDMFHLFDKLMLLEKGEVVYFGPSSEASAYFERAGHPCPPNCNPTEHFITVIASHGRELIERYTEHARASAGDLETGTVLTLEPIKGPSPMETVTEPQPTAAEPQPTAAAISLAMEEKYHATFWEQFTICLERSHKMSLRTFKPANLGASIVFALVIGFVCLRGKSLKIFDNDILRVNLAEFAVFIYGVGFMVSILASVLRLSERRMVQREYKSGAYSVTAHYIAKRIAEYWTVLLHPIVYGILVYVLVGLRVDQYLLAFFALLVICAQLASAMGIIYADLTGEIDPAMGLQGVISVLWLFTMGFYLAVADLPGWLKWMHRAQWYRPGYEALLRIQYTGQTIHHVANSTFLTPESLLRIGNDTTYGADVIFDQLGVTMELWQLFLVLFAWVIFMELLALFVMSRLVLKK